MAEPIPTDHRERLARIRRFDQLVAYLRDELGWPIDADDFEELTFEYTPEELGIDAKNAAKIQEIKRLRPLVPGQPWGIFFVKFEPKRLPVVALRRILSRGGAQEARLGQQVRAPSLGRRRPALRVQLRRGRGTFRSPSPTSRSTGTATTCRPSRCSDGTTSTRRSTSTRSPAS